MLRKTGIILLAVMLFAISGGIKAHAADPATIKEVVALVQKAADLVAKEGEIVFPKLMDPNGGFIKGDLYVFAFSLKEGEKGNLTAHAKETMVGKSLLALSEPGTNRKFAQDFLVIAEGAEGKGWTEYKWAKPDGKTIAPKATYIIKVPGKPYAVGAGIYDVTKAEAEAVK